MPRKEKDKSPKKKTKEKSPKKREDPAMDEAEINRRLLQNALDQANAKAEQKLEERLKALEAELTKKYQDERIELQDRTSSRKQCLMLSRLPITVATLIKKTKYPKGFWSY